MRATQFKKCLAMITVLTGSAAADLVQNGGFESGSFSGWSTHGNTGSMSVTGASSGINPAEGSFQASFAQVSTAGGIQQTLNLAANTPVTLSFWLYNFGGTDLTLFRAELGDVRLLNLVNAPAFGYTHYVFTNVVVNTANPVLKFTARHDPQRFLLDGVSVVVPLPGGAGMGLAGLGVVGVVGGIVRRRRA